jgi:xanthine dehydrogenase accessory factor
MNRDLLEVLAANAAAGTPCVLATVVRTEPPTSAHPGDKAVVTADGRLYGWIGGSCSEPLVRREAARAIADGLPRLVRIVPSAEAAEVHEGGALTVATTCPSGGALEIFIDPQVPRPLLVVAGDSPAAKTLLQLGALVGFRTCAVQPGMNASELGDAVAGAADAWAIVATMGHDDESALEALLAALPDADVALVASERRATAVLDGLRARGVDAAQVARVRTPAGAHRGGTQEEIALHALDDVVARRRERMTAHRAAAERLDAAPVTGFAVDPVCGMTVDVATSTHRVEHLGQTFHFCCSGCAGRFEAEPLRFTASGTMPG